MAYKIEVFTKDGFRDPHGEHVRHDIAELELGRVKKVVASALYLIEGELAEKDVRRIATELLIDPITQDFTVETVPAAITVHGAGKHAIEVWFKHGVTDTVAESVTKAIADLGIIARLTVKTGSKFTLLGEISIKAVEQVARRLLANPIIQEFKVN
jgi:phosphoribosylformylglycinamidine synthase